MQYILLFCQEDRNSLQPVVDPFWRELSWSQLRGIDSNQTPLRAYWCLSESRAVKDLVMLQEPFWKVPLMSTHWKSSIQFSTSPHFTTLSALAPYHTQSPPLFICSRIPIHLHPKRPHAEWTVIASSVRMLISCGGVSYQIVNGFGGRTNLGLLYIAWVIAVAVWKCMTVWTVETDT